MKELEKRIPGRVYQREDWGAPSTPGGSQRSLLDVTTFTQHHTTGNTLGVSDTVQWVRNIYAWHTGQNSNSPLNWADIGYAFLYDKFGNVFVGRGRYRTLAHATGYNRTHLGVAFLGTGDAGHVTPAAKIAGRALRHWLRTDGGLTNMTRTNGHRDIGNTSCPNDYLYTWAVENDMALDKEDGTVPKYLSEEAEKWLQDFYEEGQKNKARPTSLWHILDKFREMRSFFSERF